MRTSLALACAAFILTTAATADARGSGPSGPHVRPAEAAAAALVADALDRSAVVRGLATRLDATDVIAYVRLSPHRDGARESSIQFLGQSPRQRFMLILVDASLSPDRQVALVGHELQHAVDMAGVDWITDQLRMGQYFALHGWKLAYPEAGFETLSAMQTQRKVSRELATSTIVAANRPRPR